MKRLGKRTNAIASSAAPADSFLGDLRKAPGGAGKTQLTTTRYVVERDAHQLPLGRSVIGMLLRVSARRRTISTCLLRDFMAASRTKPEEQATAVIAGALRSSERFRKALLAPLQLDDEGAVEIDTEVGTGVGGEAVDLELRITTTDGRLRRRAWLEVKVNSELAEARGNKESQLIRYRHALDALDQKRPDLVPSVLGVLLRRADERRERPQIDAAGAIVLHWHDVADIAETCGRALSGADTSGEWRVLARRPGATLEGANIETMLWFLEEATSRDQNGKRREIVGVKASSPVTRQQATDYAAAYQAVRAVYLLAERTELKLEDRGRITTMLVPDSGVDDEDVFDLLTFRFKADPRGRQSWWHPLGGTAEFWFMPADPPVSADAQLWAGVCFDKSIPIPARWRGALEANGFRLDEDEDGLLVSVGTNKPLDAFTGTHPALGDQANEAATWIDARVNGLERITPSA